MNSPSEYGSYETSARKDLGARNRGKIMYAICGSALVLSIIALAQGQDMNPSMLAAAAVKPAIAVHEPEMNAAVHSKEIEARILTKSVHQADSALHIKQAVSPVSQPLKEYVAAKQKQLAKQGAAKTHDVHAHPEHSLVKVPLAAMKPAHVAEEHTAFVKHVAPVPHVVAAKPADEETKKQARAAEVRAHIVHGKMLDDASAAENSAETPAPDAGAEPTEIFHSPVGDLKPTGIMSVFFNENIMITAVCIIGFLLLAICCFARNADCALT